MRIQQGRSQLRRQPTVDRDVESQEGLQVAEDLVIKKRPKINLHRMVQFSAKMVNNVNQSTMPMKHDKILYFEDISQALVLHLLIRKP